MSFLDANDGKAGVVYILVNGAFRDDVLKIGQSTRSGGARATDLNRDAGTGTPKMFRCIYEVRTLDCGRAEKYVHAKLHKHRLTHQEFFQVELELAKQVVTEACERYNAERALVINDRTKKADMSMFNTPQSEIDQGMRQFRIWGAPGLGIMIALFNHASGWVDASVAGVVVIVVLEWMSFIKPPKRSN